MFNEGGSKKKEDPSSFNFIFSDSYYEQVA